MTRPYVSFAEIKEKVPIADALQALGIAGNFKQKGDTLSGVCPLPSHQHGRHPNPEQFKINRKNGLDLWHCFGDCQKGGDVIELVKQMTSYDNRHVRFWFAERFGDRLNLSKKKHGKQPVEKDTAHDSSKEPSQAAPLTPSNLPAEAAPLKPLRFQLNLKPDVPYLRERGLNAATIQKYGLGLCTKGVLKGYVAIPVYAYPGSPPPRPVAYLGRWPGEDYDEEAGQPRYKWPEGFLKSHVVYGLAEALETPLGAPLIVVEGPFKLYHLVQAGLPNTVAAFGSSLSDEQAALLVATGRPIALMFDGNEAGWHGMRAAAGKLITRAFVRAVKLPSGIEPDQLSAAELSRIIN